MAIYSLHHQPIGKSTQARPHTAAAHIRYIARPQAVSRIDAARMPLKPSAAASYLVEMEDGDRKNARVVDKLRLALPVELTAGQRAALVRDFADELTQGRASWYAAHHDRDDDAANPHCHLVVRDRDHETGRRVIGMSEAGSTGRIRELWEQHANRALAEAGRPERIDRRTLAAQGIDRAPTIHEGPRAQAMDRRGAVPRSQVREARNGCGARQRTRQVNYPEIDRGHSRPAYNRAIQPSGKVADYWAAIDADAQRREFEERGYGADWRRHHQAPPGPFPSGGGKRQAVEGVMARKPAQSRDDKERGLLKAADKQKRHEARYNDTMKVAYRDPAAAEERMQTYRREKGRPAMEQERAENPGRFGSAPGSRLALDGYTPGAAERRAKAAKAREKLPGAAKTHENATARLDGAAADLGVAPWAEDSRSFARRLAEKRAAENTLEGREQRKARDLERLRRGREQEKERGR